LKTWFFPDVIIKFTKQKKTCQNISSSGSRAYTKGYRSQLREEKMIPKAGYEKSLEISKCLYIPLAWNWRHAPDWVHWAIIYPIIYKICHIFEMLKETSRTTPIFALVFRKKKKGPWSSQTVFIHVFIMYYVAAGCSWIGG